MAASFGAYQEKIDHFLHNENNPLTNLLEALERKTGIDRTRIFTGFGLFLSVYLVIGFGRELLCHLIGFVYPAYASIKAIESPSRESDSKWLTYWVVFGLFSLFEAFSDIFLSWIPLYFLLKCVFLIYCMVPVPWNGSSAIYSTFIRPFVLQHEQQIDAGIKTATNFARNVGGDLAAEAIRENMKKEN